VILYSLLFLVHCIFVFLQSWSFYYHFFFVFLTSICFFVFFYHTLLVIFAFSSSSKPSLWQFCKFCSLLFCLFYAVFRILVKDLVNLQSYAPLGRLQ